MKRWHGTEHLRRRRVPAGEPGAVPGTLVARTGASPSRIVVRRFGPKGLEEHALEHVDELSAPRDPTTCLWVEITGLADTDSLAAVGRAFGLHALSLEDVLDPAQRPKVEQYEHYTFIVLATLSATERIDARPLHIFQGDGFLVTLEDTDSGALGPVRERLRHGRGKIRSRGADYLAYAIIDAVVDHYFPIVEAFDDHLERVEDAVVEARDVDPIELARQARHDLRTIRHALWPARDVISGLMQEDGGRMSDETRVYLRDCYDHVMQLQEMVEASREIAASLLEAYLSAISVRTNEVMRVLAVIGTIFIPLTFVTGLYGMNFDPSRSPLNMPELRWYWGYPYVLVLMATIALGSLVYFYAKGWFGPRRRHGQEKR